MDNTRSVRRKADFADPRSNIENARSVVRISGKVGLGKRIVPHRYSNAAPTLVGSETGLVAHPDAALWKLERPLRGKYMFNADRTGGPSKVFASALQQANLGAQVRVVSDGFKVFGYFIRAISCE